MTETVQQTLVRVSQLKNLLDELIAHKYLQIDAGGYILHEDETIPLCQEIEGLANEILITDQGHPHFVNHHLLKQIGGYSVIKGESDGYGWLTGVIITPKGHFVYG